MEAATRPPVGGRVSATNVTLGQLVRGAYGIQESQILGKPDWFDSARWDIEAQADGEIGTEQMQVMLQSLLTERFRLELQRGTTEVPVLALVVARNGHKLKSHPGECLTPPAGTCGGFRASNGRIQGDGVSMEPLAARLSRSLAETVQDRTGIAGAFDLTLEWTPDGPNAAPQPGADAPSIFTAVQEQLGLRLESQRGSVETYTVLRAERPTAN
jgi:uncharacterized protein (TIGR03435 family)